MPQEPRVLVLTLYSGEGEFEACCASVADQVGVAQQHVVFSFLDNVAAHEAVYGRIMAEAENFDVFVKLDADMVLTRPDTLRIVADHFADPTLDLLTLRVFDVPSQGELLNFHAFSSRMRWRLPITNRLSPDHNPVPPERKKTAPATPGPLVTHMSAPTREQAYIYGYHRALKIAQRGGHVTLPYLALDQYRLLARIRRQFRLGQDELRALMLLGFRDGLRSEDDLLVSKRAGHVIPAGDVVALANRHWGRGSTWNAAVFLRYALPRHVRWFAMRARMKAGEVLLGRAAKAP